jgi:outer membrane protein assembly factor BamB
MSGVQYMDRLIAVGTCLRSSITQALVLQILRKIPSTGIQILGAIGLYFGSCLLTVGADWQQYAGPNGDGSSPEFIRTNWAASPPKVLWRKPIGPGFSSIVTGNGRLFTQSKKAPNAVDRELCVALDAITGATLWQVDVGLAQYTDLAGYDERIDGPRSTPSVDGDFVYVLNAYLKLYCLRAATGAEVWSRDFKAELGSQIIEWQNTASPLIVGDLILLNMNAGTKKLIAVRKSDGATVWRAENVGMTHATPILATVEDIPQVIFLTLSGLVSVVPETGIVLWRIAFSPSSISTAASPTVAGNSVQASAAYGSGSWLARLSRTDSGFSATTVSGFPRRGNDYQYHWSTPVTEGGYIYSVAGGSSGQAKLACFDPVGGTNRWTQMTVGSGRIGLGSIIRSANCLIVMTESGELALVRPNPAAFQLIGKLKVLTDLCWNRSTLANGRLYVRNSSLTSEILAIDVAPPIPPLAPVQVSAERDLNGTLRLEVLTVDGTPLEAAHGQRLELVFATEVTSRSRIGRLRKWIGRCRTDVCRLSFRRWTCLRVFSA